MPRTNPQRRHALTDAAIALLASQGVHGLTHRSVERSAGLPAGTASNYFRSRGELLVATARRVVELHVADMERAVAQDVAVRRPPHDDGDAADATPASTALIDLIAASLETAVTVHRDRYLAIFELLLEARRRPELGRELAGLALSATGATAAQHAGMGADVPPEAESLLVTLYGGALFTLVTGPEAGRPAPRDLARAIVRGAVT